MEVVKTAWVGVKFNENFICIETYSGYRSSQADPKGAQYLLSPDTNDQELGAALLGALGKSRFVLSVSYAQFTRLNMNHQFWDHSK